MLSALLQIICWITVYAVLLLVFPGPMVFLTCVGLPLAIIYLLRNR